MQWTAISSAIAIYFYLPHHAQRNEKGCVKCAAWTIKGAEHGSNWIHGIRWLQKARGGGLANILGRALQFPPKNKTCVQDCSVLVSLRAV